MRQAALKRDGLDDPIVQSFLEHVSESAGTVLQREGTPGDDCYLIDEGLVRIEVDRAHVDTDAVIAFVEAGATCGELAFLDGGARSATAVAHTDVRARRLTREAFERLRGFDPAALTVITTLAASAAGRARRLSRSVESFVAPSQPDPAADAVVAHARAAQGAINDLEVWSDERLDDLLAAISAVVCDRAEELADLTVAETGMGNAADKVTKIRFAARDVAAGLRTTPRIGFREPAAEELGVDVFATPVGVVLGLTPVTNPAPTIVFKALIAIRSRNAIIFSPHPSAAAVSVRATELIRTALRDAGCPDDLVQCLPGGGSRTRTALFMRHPGVDLILATGGTAMVKAAYASGTPAIGVGSGNAPALICADADLEAAGGVSALV